MKKIISVLLFCFSMPAFALNTAHLKEKIVKQCQNFEEEEIIANKAPKCKKEIANYLKKVNADKIPRFDQGLYAILSIALRTEIPEAYQIIEKEIYEGNLNEWTDKLEELNYDLYVKSITKWARHVEAEVRKNYKADQNKSSDYAVKSEDEKNQTAPELMSIWSPILMTKYLTLLNAPNFPIESADLSSINIIYAFSTPSFREVFGTQISQVILKASDKWVVSIRKEKPWVLFRLFPLIPNHPDGNMKRELIWIEKYHSDFRIRSLASATLARVAE